LGLNEPETVPSFPTQQYQQVTSYLFKCWASGRETNLERTSTRSIAENTRGKSIKWVRQHKTETAIQHRLPYNPRIYYAAMQHLILKGAGCVLSASGVGYKWDRIHGINQWDHCSM